LIKIVFPLWSKLEYLTPDEMRAAERGAFAMGVSAETLMENAGRAVAEVVDDRFGPGASHTALVVCGPGNNGGDGFVAARYLKARGWTVLVLLLGAPAAIRTEESSKNWRRVENLVTSVVSPEELARYGDYFARSDVILGAITGTGFSGGLREPAATAVNMMNGSGAKRVAVDIPSGLDPLSGESHGPVFRADITVTFHRAKTGLRGKGEYTGEVLVVPIGI